MKSPTRAWIYLITLALVLIVLGHWLGGRDGVLWGVAMALSINSVMYFFGDARILQSVQGHHLEGQDPWRALEILSTLSRKARIPEPKLLVMDQSSPQAFAVGRSWKEATVVVTQGLLDSFDRGELEAILAYQVACIKRLDTLSFGISSLFATLFLWVTRGLDAFLRLITGAKKDPYAPQSHIVTYITAPVVALLLRSSVGSSSYYHIDQLAAELTGQPKTLAQALWKLDSLRATQPFSVSPAAAHMFIVNPLTGKGWSRYFQAQPPVKKRIQNLLGYYPI
ncbi:MAG: M48 family metalloprotease [Pseudobdellovibrionaceae bacterium]|nr:M48 family metalloprotease [Bdellovibrionales bacterium]USN47523.1 MAG: M48 family metalloprotease [Pseudobdellovibrionaceae bacterium]